MVTTLTLIIILYAVLGVATIAILRLLSRRWRQGEMAEEAVPYGPPRAAGRGTWTRQGCNGLPTRWAASCSQASTLYAVLGGADFGGGLWDLLAGTTAQGRAPRATD